MIRGGNGKIMLPDVEVTVSTYIVTAEFQKDILDAVARSLEDTEHLNKIEVADGLVKVYTTIDRRPKPAAKPAAATPGAPKEVVH